MKKLLIGSCLGLLMIVTAFIGSITNAHAAYDRHDGSYYSCNVIRNDGYAARNLGFYTRAFDFRREYWRYCRHRKD